MNQRPRTYRSYLLRLRLVEDAGQPVCRASLQAPGQEREIYFESLREMCAYLAREIGFGKLTKTDEMREGGDDTV